MKILKLRLMKLVSLENLFSESLADHFSCFWNVLSCKIVRIFNVDFIDLVGFNVFLFDKIDEVDFTSVIALIIWIKYVWTINHPPVWKYSSERPLAYWVSLSLRYPGGRIWRAGGVLFWMTRVDYWVLVIILLNPVNESA